MGTGILFLDLSIEYTAVETRIEEEEEEKEEKDAIDARNEQQLTRILHHVHPQASNKVKKEVKEIINQHMMIMQHLQEQQQETISILNDRAKSLSFIKNVFSDTEDERKLKGSKNFYHVLGRKYVANLLGPKTTCYLDPIDHNMLVFQEKSIDQH